MKKSNLFRGLTTLFLVLTMLVSTVSALTEPTATESEVVADRAVYGCFSADATDAFLGTGQMVKNAASVFLYELNSQTLMYAWEPDVALPPSSFVKILTAIIAIENGDLDSAVTVTEAALADLPASAVSVDLIINEVMPLKDLLYCMLVGSANDAAAVIAQYIGGGQALFAEKMNQYAQMIGCTSSHFTNPHGLHDPLQVTSARDTAKILEYALKNEVFRTIFCTVEYSVPATNKSNERYLITGNYLMSMDEVEIYFDERVVGGRTGVANDRTRCLATIARSGSMELLCVVMGSASVYEEGGSKIRSFGGYTETKTLLDSGFTGYSVTQILYDGQVLTQYDLQNADALLSVGPNVSISTVLPDEITPADLNFRYSEDSRQIQTPVQKGDLVGNVEVWYQGLCLAKADLFAMNDARQSNLVSVEAEEPDSLWPVVALLFAIGLCVVAVVYIFRSKYGRRLLRKLRRARRKKG